MDIARPEFKTQKRRRQTMIVIAVVLGVAAVSFGVSRLKPAAPTVERGTVWTDTVKRGPMLRQVRGTGSLVPSQEAVRQIPAETEATVVRILMLPGSLTSPLKRRLTNLPLEMILKRRCLQPTSGPLKRRWRRSKPRSTRCAR